MPDRVLNFVVAFLVAMLPTACILTAGASVVLLMRPNQIPKWQGSLAIVLMVGLSVYAGVRYSMWVDRSWRDPDRRRCQACGYILKGLLANRCPECGARFNTDEVRKAEAESADAQDL